MHQVAFSDQSIIELNKLPPEEQMLLIETLSDIQPEELLNKKPTDFGKIHRDGKVFFRLRPKDYRIYFEIKEDNILFCHYILHQHTFSDFLFRFKLPITEEQMIEQNHSFWKYIETLK
ncbi:hypothetical protein AYO37_01230 [Opitutia bacterium SCGC AG-212-L18]|nr:hypothetical protein AYO37_01230 [Opitutae bacterium SCGC AG-212-L18]